MPNDTPDSTPQRQFSVHGVEDAPSRALILQGASFEDAAFHYLEDRHVGDDEVSLLVEDVVTGERQCFRIDLETGETAPCS